MKQRKKDKTLLRMKGGGSPGGGIGVLVDVFPSMLKGETVGNIVSMANENKGAAPELSLRKRSRSGKNAVIKYKREAEE